MTDNRIEKIREEFKRLREQLQNKVEESDFISGEVFIIHYFLTFIDSLQKEPVRNDFEMALAEMIDNAQKRVVEPWVVAAQWKDELIKLAKSEEPISEELEEAASRYAKEEYNRKNPATLPNRCIGCYAPLMYAFEAGAKWKEKHLTKDATEVTVHIDAGGYPYTPEIELYDYDKDAPLAKEGDKYKVILIKED
jgi:ATP-dependent exoDNAse (exonuclease V) beta subunit